MDSKINSNNYSNKKLRKMLTETIIGERLCHAYLFYGKKGIGKKNLAKYFAAAILCKGKNIPCNECTSCHKIKTDNHPDLFMLDTKETKNSIYVETIREIRQDAYIKPNESDYKVYIIPNAENMTISASNALLKVLEEPPLHTVFILTSSNKEELPQTICSRCITFEAYPMPEEELYHALKELFVERSDEECKKASELANGIIGKGIEILSGEGYQTILQNAKEVLLALSSLNEYQLLLALTKTNSSKEQMLLFLEELTVLVRNCILTRLNVKTTNDEDICHFSYKYTVPQMNLMIDILEKARLSIEQNVNMGILTNMLSANLMQAVSK